MPGKVYLIGAGPGDPELMTLKAVRLLSTADIVLVDALVDRRALVHVRRQAQVIDVGKRGGCKSTPQRFIHHLMIRYAREGLVVARLKGGDPFVFGRGGEEALALAAAGIDVEVVSGVTAGIAASAAAGVPLTHRGLACGVTFVTGHVANDVADDAADHAQPDWAALARGGTTLVLYMAVAALPRIARALVAGGLPAQTPAVVIERATLPGERILRGNLAELAREDIAHGVTGPAIIVIGAVADAVPTLARSGAAFASLPARAAA